MCVCVCECECHCLGSVRVASQSCANKIVCQTHTHTRVLPHTHSPSLALSTFHVSHFASLARSLSHSLFFIHTLSHSPTQTHAHTYESDAGVLLAAIEVDDEEQSGDVDDPLDEVLPAQVVHLGVVDLEQL